MPLTAASTEPITAELQQMLGLAVDVGAQIEHPGLAAHGGQGGADGRAIDTRQVLSTKRAVAISAPVLPALAQSVGFALLTRLIATRIEESF